MLKRFLAIAVMLFAGAAFAGVDINQASEADLDGILGIGPAMSAKILNERKNGNFQDWADLVRRVKGIGQANAARLSTQGLTVDGASFEATGATKSKALKKTPKE